MSLRVGETSGGYLIVQLGFVIDQSRCIGCHACTVACKSENHVPVGNFRTWVKYTESGEFPSVKRSFAVLRCNQCTSAPCVTICPVSALEKRADGIVDVDPDVCIGCKACMQGCPYDALYLNADKGTVEKCHFCAHRTERGLAPACAVVCPTEAILPGDFHDPESRVSQMKREIELTARKSEAGTGPNVLYRDVAPAGVDPLETNASGGFLWAGRQPGLDIAAHEFEALEEKARARTVYDVAHPALWGTKITGYLFFKSLAAGVFLAASFAGLLSGPWREGDSVYAPQKNGLAVAILGLLFLAVTSALLVLDLKRPERFLSILRRPNWSSWLVRGTYALITLGGLFVLWAILALAGAWPRGFAHGLLSVLTAVAGALAACYTGWLFGQAKGRVLWMRRGLWAHLIVQAVAAGAALLLVFHGMTGLFHPDEVASLRGLLAAWLGLHLAFSLFEGRLAPRGREREYARAHALVTEGPYALRHWRAGLGLGAAVPLVLFVLPAWGPLTFLAALLVLVGLWV